MENHSSIPNMAPGSYAAMNGATAPGVGNQVSNPVPSRFDVFNVEPVAGNARLEDDVTIAEDPAADSAYFNIEIANDVIEDEMKKPNPRSLWHNLWFEHEVCCLFADTNVGKSILAVQIGCDVAEKVGAENGVLYFDFEMSRKQFQRRYTDEDTNTAVTLPANFYRAEFNDEATICDDVTEIIARIELAAIEHKACAIIIDNISWITAKSEAGDVAAILMQQLVLLKKKRRLSILVLAHTPKRNMNMPLTQNSLGGSKKLGNFMDAMFAIGHSKKGPGCRYIKQIKVRSAEMEYGADNVIEGHLEKSNGFLRFVEDGFGTESDNLEEYTELDARREETIAAIKALRAQGKSQREIQALGYSMRQIKNVMRQMKADVYD